MVSLLVKKEVMAKFWKVLDPEMTAGNRVLWVGLREVGRLAGALQNLLAHCWGAVGQMPDVAPGLLPA